MRKILPLIIMAILMLSSCFDDEADSSEILVNQFVQQLKNGTYNNYKYREDGEKLWTMLPQFSKKDAYQLILTAKDTTLVAPINHFPINLMASMFPNRITDEKLHIVLGEYLLWCAEGIIRDNKFPSLVPILQKKIGEKRTFNLSGKEILQVRELYLS